MSDAADLVTPAGARLGPAARRGRVAGRARCSTCRRWIRRSRIRSSRCCSWPARSGSADGCWRGARGAAAWKRAPRCSRRAASPSSRRRCCRRRSRRGGDRRARRTRSAELVRLRRCSASALAAAHAARDADWRRRRSEAITSSAGHRVGAGPAATRAAAAVRAAGDQRPGVDVRQPQHGRRGGGAVDPVRPGGAGPERVAATGGARCGGDGGAAAGRARVPGRDARARRLDRRARSGSSCSRGPAAGAVAPRRGWC